MGDAERFLHENKITTNNTYTSEQQWCTHATKRRKRSRKERSEDIIVRGAQDEIITLIKSREKEGCMRIILHIYLLYNITQ